MKEANIGGTPFELSQYNWAPDSKSIEFTSNKRGNPDV
jgi:Tol biopolymer transport system component